jgi:hypothetical protein
VVARSDEELGDRLGYDDGFLRVLVFRFSQEPSVLVTHVHTKFDCMAFRIDVVT